MHFFNPVCPTYPIYLKEVWHMKLWQGHFTKMMDNLLRPAQSQLFASQHGRKLSLKFKLFKSLLFLQVLCKANSSPHGQTIHHLLSNVDLGLFYRQIFSGTRPLLNFLHRLCFDWHLMKFLGLIPFISLVYLNIRILISLRNLRSRLNTRCQETQESNPVKGKL